MMREDVLILTSALDWGVGEYVWTPLEELFVEDCLVGDGGGDERGEDGEEKPFRAH